MDWYLVIFVAALFMIYVNTKLIVTPTVLGTQGMSKTVLMVLRIVGTSQKIGNVAADIYTTK